MTRAGLSPDASGYGEILNEIPTICFCGCNVSSPPDLCPEPAVLRLSHLSAGWKLRRVRRSLVNGLVCKVVKSKTNSAALPQAATKPAERSSALLGIIEPEVLRSKEKAGTNPAGAEPAPAAVPGSASSNSAAAAGPPSSSFDIPNKSLGEIARAYRNEAATRMAINSEADLEQNRPNPKAEPVAPPSNSHTTPIAATVAQPRIRKGSQEFVFPIPPCRGAELSGRLLLGRPAGRRNRLINEGFCSRASNTRKRKWQLHHELWFYVALHLRAYGNDHDHLCLRRKSAAQSSINSSVCHGLLGARYSRLRAFPPRLPRSRSRKHLASPAKATMRSSLSFMKWRDYLTE